MGTIMNREVKKFHAFAFAIIAVTLAVIISIFPLRIWNLVQTEVGGGEENGYTQGIDSTHDAIQDFVAQYDRIDSLSVYVNELTKGRYMHITFWDVDNWKVMYEETIDLGEEELPGYVDIPLGLDLEVGTNYRVIFTVWHATYVLGTESVEGSTNPAIGSFYYQDSVVEGSHLLAKYNYKVPISKLMSLSLMVMVFMIGCALVGVTRSLCREAKDKYITIYKACQYILNPIAIFAYAVLAIMVFPLKIFDDRGSDIFFYELGLFIAFIAALYAINHKRNDSIKASLVTDASFSSLSIYEKVMSAVQMVLIALALVYSAQYMNDLYDIYHSISERQMVLCLLLITVCFQSKKELVSIQNIVITIAGIIGGYVYYGQNMLPVTEKEYDLHNLILKLGIAIAVVCVILVADFIRYLIRLLLKKVSGVSTSITLYGVFAIAFFVCLIVLRNTRWWGVVLALVFAAMYIRMNMADRSAKWNIIATGGLILNIAYTIGYCLLFRYFTGFVMGRYSMQFHTVTVTAEYLTIMQVMAAALLIAKVASASKIKGFKDFISYIWKEMFFFGVISAYMIFTLSRTGYLAAAVTIILLIVMVVVREGKDAMGVLARSLGALIVAVIIAFPMTFTLQRIVPVLVGHPYFYEVEDAAPSTRGGKDLDDYKYMSIERFYSLFRQKILGVSATEYDFIEDPYNYDENGNYIYDEDGNLISEEISSIKASDSYVYEVYDEEGAEKLIASSDDGIFVAEAVENEESVLGDAEAEANSDSEVIAESDSTEESSDSEDIAEDDNADESSEESDSDSDYSNGRIDIWKAYLKELNMTGHNEMGATAEDGEVLAHAHNVYIQVAYDHGIPVGILFGLLIVAGIAFSGVYYFRNKELFGAAVPFAVITGFAIAGLTEWNFQLCNAMTVALMLCLPAIMFKARKEK